MQSQTEIELKPLPSELRRLQRLVVAAYGAHDPLVKLLASAVESGDPRSLLVAKAAFDGHPRETKRRILNGWDPGPEPSPECVELGRQLEKPLRLILQVDGCNLGIDGGDSFMRVDDDGHCVVGGIQWEPRTMQSAVRLQILAGTDKATVLVLLEKIVAGVRRDWELLIAPSSRSSGGDDGDDLTF